MNVSRVTPPFFFRIGRIALAVLAALSLAGCATSRGPAIPVALPDRFPDHSAEEIGFLLSQAADTLVAFQTVSRAAIASPEGSYQFTADVDHRRHDSIRIDVKVQFGIEAARILFTPDSVFVYDRVKKTLFYGDTESVGSLLPLPWRSPDLFLDMLGLPDVDVDGTWGVEADSLRYYLTSSDNLKKLFVDPALWRIVRSEVRDSNGSLQEERAFLDFEAFDGLVLPRRIVVRRPGERFSATISHRSIVLNPDRLDLTFHISDDARHVRIQ